MEALAPACCQSVGSAASDSAWTMVSSRRSELVVSEVETQCAEAYVEEEARSWGVPYAQGMAKRALQLVSSASGGACIILAPDAELQKLAPHAHVSDGGGMTQRMRGINARSAEFQELFHEFAQHTSTDRWPADHPDGLLRGRPKDGVGVLLSPLGFRVKCAVRLEGLPHASKAWSCMGMRHNAALAAIDVMSRAMVCLRSESGMVHVLGNGPSGICAFCVDDCSDCSFHPEREAVASVLRSLSQSELIDNMEDTDFETLEAEAGKLVMARQELEEKLVRLRGAVGVRSLGVAAALHDLGVVCREGGDLSAARQYLQESLDLSQKLLGKGPSAEVAACLHELGLVFREIRHLRMAQRSLEKALKMKEALGAGDVNETARELGALCGQRLRLKAAQQHLEGALKSMPADGSAEADTEQARTLRELGLLEMRGGNFHAAFSHLQHALEIERKLHGTSQHPDVAKTLYSLGLVVLRSGDHNESRTHLEESLKISRAIHGDTPHPDVQKVLRLVAALSARDGDIGQWRSSRKEAMRMHKAIHHTQGISCVPARIDMLGLFLVERALAVSSRVPSRLDGVRAATTNVADRLRAFCFDGGEPRGGLSTSSRSSVGSSC
mmetsp:Transcript_83076/g.238705  ORF Transcript_83076/g.238705 Transcript_83076/m.238705 type:complete len:612 (-) Transcript_83076:70-1905(-)